LLGRPVRIASWFRSGHIDLWWISIYDLGWCPVSQAGHFFKNVSMARIQINYRYLFELNNDINMQIKNSPAFHFLNKPKIDRFRRENMMQLKILESRINELADKHAMHDEHNKPVIENGEFKFFTPEAKQAYLDSINKFLSQQTFLNE
jgi:hypothetical protein